jgi:hypothetical protein
MRDLFIGKPIHWLIWVVIVIVLFAMGKVYLQTREFDLFLAVIVGLGAGAVMTVLLTTAKGEQVTRENFDDADWEQSAADE